MHIIKKLYKLTVYFIVLVLFFLVISNVWIINATKDKVYTDIDEVPVNDVALVLGTSKQLVNGDPNPFFIDRIKAAVKLYEGGKVKHFILSGDNAKKYYNEPQFMKEALLKRGIPDSVVTLDNAGLRTLDSVVRSHNIFGQDNVTIVTQKFHSYRALYISEHIGMDAVAFAAHNLPLTESFDVMVRELFARPKAILDLYVLHTAPKVMGEKEVIDI